jgi:hypothetical protein
LSERQKGAIFFKKEPFPFCTLIQPFGNRLR